MYYYYCPNCGFEEIVNNIPRDAAGNCRDGYGIPIHHYECKICHNLDAGAMAIIHGDDDEKEYYQAVIEMYQGIRGIKDYS